MTSVGKSCVSNYKTWRLGANIYPCILSFLSKGAQKAMQDGG